MCNAVSELDSSWYAALMKKRNEAGKTTIPITEGEKLDLIASIQQALRQHGLEEWTVANQEEFIRGALYFVARECRGVEAWESYQKAIKEARKEFASAKARDKERGVAGGDSPRIVSSAHLDTTLDLDNPDIDAHPGPKPKRGRPSRGK